MASLAKITPPKPSRVYPRERLFSALDSARDRPVVWISAPPGAGKTTLIASYLAARKLRPLWYRLDDGDADPATLFYYLGLAAKQVAPRRKKPLPAFTPEYLRGLPAFTRRYFQDLYDRLPQPFAVVFDNYQDLGPETRVHEVMQHALAEVPEHGNVIIMSRAEPPEQLVRLRATDTLYVIGPEAMQLTPEESTGIIKSRDVKVFSDEHCRQLSEQTQGWTAGLVLLCESIRAGGAQPACPAGLAQAPLPATANRQTVFDYFAGEILRRADSETQDVLFTTALLPTISGPLAIAITGRPRAAQILRELSRNNYFTLSDGQAEPVYQYHPLFREFLLARADQAYTSERLLELRRHAATLLEQGGQIEEATELYARTEAWSELARLVTERAGALIKEGRHKTLLAWFAYLPPSLCNDDPWLSYWHAEAQLPTDPGESHPQYERAFSLFQARGDRPGMFLAWSGLTLAVRFNPHADIRVLKDWIVVLEELLSIDSGFPSEEIEYQISHSIVRAIFWGNPRHPDYGTWKQRALRLARGGIDPLRRANTVYMIVIYELIAGNLAQAGMEIESVARLRLADMPPLVANLAHMSLAFYQRETGMLDACLKTVTEGLATSRISGVHIWDFHLRGSGVWAALRLGDFALADKLLHGMAENLNVNMPGEGSWYHSLVSSSAMLRGNLAVARQHSSAAIALAAGWPYFEGIGHCMLMSVLCATGEFEDARQHAAKMQALGREILSESLIRESFVYEAIISFATGDDAAGITALQQALALVRSRSARAFMWVPPVDLARLYARALQAGIEVDYVRSLIRCWKILPESPEIENWPWPLKIYTLGRFAVLVDDAPLASSRKAPKKLITLLKALIALGGREVPERQLADAMWPDEEGDAARELLATALHRLRKLLGDTEAIVLHEGRLTLDPQRVWVDAWAFERLLADGNGSGQSVGAERTSKALALYQGNFLAGDDDAYWAVSTRERLRGKFIRHLSGEAKTLERAGRVEDASNLYARGIETDNLAEEFYQGLMRCRLDQGRAAEALSLYRSLKQILSVTLGISPSPATETLYRELRGV